jgi:outer membrane protein assembly factor BamD
MMRISKQAWALTALLLAAILAVSCGFRRKAYENPITKDTQQPDKVLFDKAIRDIERGRYEIARLTLNTLINTYDTSEFLAKAKLAIADSWYREGGGHGLAQAEAEYKDFILFYPTMEEAAESQEKICMIHYREMDKADRDPNNALRAEQECRQLLVQFPNSKFAPSVEQRLREIQEVLAEAEMKAGDFYHHKGNSAAAANRLGALVDQYPLYSRADEALWLQADSYGRMGPRFRPQTGQAYAKLIKDYPLSPYASQAKKKLESMELPIPEADPAAVARMKYEAENRTKPGLVHKSSSFLRRGPEVSSAAKAGTPTMKNPVASIPVSVPVPAAAVGFSGDVTVAPVGANSALDSQPDARSGAAGSTAGAVTGGATTPAAGAATGSSASPATATSGASPQQPVDLPDPKAKKKKEKKKKTSPQVNPAATQSP